MLTANAPICCELFGGNKRQLDGMLIATLQTIHSLPDVLKSSIGEFPLESFIGRFPACSKGHLVRIVLRNCSKQGFLNASSKTVQRVPPEHSPQKFWVKTVLHYCRSKQLFTTTQTVSVKLVWTRTLSNMLCRGIFKCRVGACNRTAIWQPAKSKRFVIVIIELFIIMHCASS